MAGLFHPKGRKHVCWGQGCLASGSQRYWSTAVPLPSQVCCAGLVAHMGPKMLTVHYPEWGPGKTTATKRAEWSAMQLQKSTRQQKAWSKFFPHWSVSQMYCLGEKTHASADQCVKCHLSRGKTRYMWYACIYKDYFLQESLSSWLTELPLRTRSEWLGEGLVVRLFCVFWSVSSVSALSISRGIRRKQLSMRRGAWGAPRMMPIAFLLCMLGAQVCSACESILNGTWTVLHLCYTLIKVLT